MSNPVVGKLIRKELSLNRYFMLAAIFAGLLSLVICCFGVIAFFAGSIMFLTAVIAYGVILPMYTISAERKEKSLLFVLSLPISRSDYVFAKVIGVVLSFIAPWSVMLLGAILLIAVTPIPDGMITFTILLMTFSLSNFCLIVCAAMLIRSEAVMALVVILTNMSVTFFMVGVINLTTMGQVMSKDIVLWDHDARAILGCELATIALAFALFYWINRREPDLV